MKKVSMVISFILAGVLTFGSVISAKANYDGISIAEEQYARSEYVLYKYGPDLEAIMDRGFIESGMLKSITYEAAITADGMVWTEEQRAKKSKLRYIGDEVFAGCKSLQSSGLSAVTEYIGDRAYLGCTSISIFVLPGTVTHIGEFAIGYDGTVYYDVANRKYTTTPGNQIQTITLLVERGSLGESYARENLFKTQYLDDMQRTTYIPGDFNHDDTVSIEDCQGILKYYVDGLSGKNARGPEITVRNDLNNDNYISVEDAQMLLRYITEVKTAGKSGYTWYDLRKAMGMV